MRIPVRRIAKWYFPWTVRKRLNEARHYTFWAMQIPVRRIAKRYFPSTVQKRLNKARHYTFWAMRIPVRRITKRYFPWTVQKRLNEARHYTFWAMRIPVRRITKWYFPGILQERLNKTLNTLRIKDGLTEVRTKWLRVTSREQQRYANLQVGYKTRADGIEVSWWYTHVRTPMEAHIVTVSNSCVYSHSKASCRLCSML
jgi:hypothetical protein